MSFRTTDYIPINIYMHTCIYSYIFGTMHIHTKAYTYSHTHTHTQNIIAQNAISTFKKFVRNI